MNVAVDSADFLYSALQRIRLPNMSQENMNDPSGLKLRYGPGGEERAEEVARTLLMPPVLEADDSLAPEALALDVSYHSGKVERDVEFERFID